MCTVVMAISGEEIRRRTRLDRVLEWFDTEDEEFEAQSAYQTLEDEYLY